MSRSIAFGARRIGPDQPVIVIAEIGVNHEGDVAVCARMIEAAADAGADAMKLQTMDADENYVPGTESHTLFSACALSREDTAAMFDLARSRGIEPFTTAGDFPTLDWVDRLNPAAHKISSGLLNHIPAIEYAAAKGRSLLMSTGMAGREEIDDAVAAATSARATGIGLFQCTSVYPAPEEDLNLHAVAWLADHYRLPTGFSDHSKGVDAAPFAVAAGACMIEKHFTLDRQRDSYDHRLSLEPKEFATMVAAIRRAETMLGPRERVLSSSEITNAKKFQRCLVARKPIAMGETFDVENLTVMRPLPDKRGLAPKHYERVLGRKSALNLATHDPVGQNAVEGLG